ncbi:uncharacterized protein Pyn_02788 [Prunus yedoensis var. nudiflora]|uniref:Uncharacterized protein n=1 Tax=Prunus yedoensis var. nudiflora TaxID=2094558 RepID=A0A314UT50_PRUYE|nr:uncharacterized protein Pyn_02788 [Prunus yedoensis var. nudiflora]
MATSTSAHCLLLFLLCLSLHACNARRLGAVDKKPENKLHLINKSTKEKGSNDNIPVVAKVKSFSSKEAPEVAKEQSTAETQSDNSINTKEPKQTKTSDVSRKTKRSASGAVEHHPTTADDVDNKSSFDSVSWRVPHKKRGVQKQPGFNLDYSPPKTHPPSHN